MFALPVPAPVTTPAFVTEAVLDALEVNVNLLLSRTPVPFLKIPITFSFLVAPLAIEKLPPSTAMVVRSSYQLPP